MMENKITEFLLENFPDRETLSYDEFIHHEAGMALISHIYDYDETLQESAYRVISHPWPEIYWPDIADIGGPGSDSWMLPAFLNKKTFMHSFPSLLNFLFILPTVGYSKISTNCEMFFNDFMSELNPREVRQEWKREYYYALNVDVKKVICKILTLSQEREPMGYAKDTLASYWAQFSE